MLSVPAVFDSCKMSIGLLENALSHHNLIKFNILTVSGGVLLSLSSIKRTKRFCSFSPHRNVNKPVFIYMVRAQSNQEKQTDLLLGVYLRRYLIGFSREGYCDSVRQDFKSFLINVNKINISKSQTSTDKYV